MTREETKQYYLDEFKKYENFYLDTSGLFNPTRARSAVKLFANAHNTILKERLLFATDWPVPAISHY
jgi:predicted TIM-barrel fold metal-dependent hydrolase